MGNNLEFKFEKAFNKISELEGSLPPDIMLKLYAYYKQATSGDTFFYDGKTDVIDAFKFNAWTQLNGMSQDEAKKIYIGLVKNILKLNKDQNS